jgi:hypothetical protein
MASGVTSLNFWFWVRRRISAWFEKSGNSNQGNTVKDWEQLKGIKKSNVKNHKDAWKQSICKLWVEILNAYTFLKYQK